MLVVGKFVLTLLQRVFFPQRARTAGRSQIREFSFILGATAVTVGVFKEQYALLSITLNPFLFQALPWIEAHMRKMHAFWSLQDRMALFKLPKWNHCVNMS
jgi:monovalent cation:H+ antiporter-2, CPA2 family